MTDEKICFVISPIGSEDSEIRKRSDQVFNHIITPTVYKFGYKPIRADQIPEPGIITSQIIQSVVDSALVIADLTGRNPNVFYELAIRHAIKKPYIQLIRKGENIPFDVAATRTIFIDIHDLDVAEKAKQELESQIKSIEEDGDIDSPISVAIDLKILRESNKPEERAYVDLINEITNIRNQMRMIEEKIGNPEQILPPNYIHHIFRDVIPLTDISLSLRERDIISKMESISLDLHEVLEKEELDEKDIESLRDISDKLNAGFRILRRTKRMR